MMLPISSGLCEAAPCTWFKHPEEVQTEGRFPIVSSETFRYHVFYLNKK